MYGIYIHIPFCVKKCNYCDFASYPDKLNRQDEYINALTKEFEMRKGLCIDTVYIGGGTPSVLTEDNINYLLKAINKNFVLNNDTEFTVEVNPKTIDERKATILKSGGVNRISMGAQSFLDSELSAIGRVHSSQDIEDSYNLLRKKGFDNISLDLMYALPGQTLESLNVSIDKLLLLNPEHISCYGLKYEEGTPLYNMLNSGKITECSEDMFADMYNHIRERLAQNGYIHYEISNFCKDKKHSRHNLKYWTMCNYVGFGLGASSFEDNRRYTHTADFDKYIESYDLCEDYVMDNKELMSEFVILGLRVLNDGVDKNKFYQKYNVNLDEHFKDAIQKTKDCLINTQNSLKLKNEAVLVSNSIMCEFLG